MLKVNPIYKLDYFLELIFEWILVDVWSQNGAELAPELDQKSMLISKGGFSNEAFKHL